MGGEQVDLVAELSALALRRADDPGEAATALLMAAVQLFRSQHDAAATIAIFRDLVAEAEAVRVRHAACVLPS